MLLLYVLFYNKNLSDVAFLNHDPHCSFSMNGPYCGRPVFRLGLLWPYALMTQVLSLFPENSTLHTPLLVLFPRTKIFILNVAPGKMPLFLQTELRCHSLHGPFSTPQAEINQSVFCPGGQLLFVIWLALCICFSKFFLLEYKLFNLWDHNLIWYLWSSM